MVLYLSISIALLTARTFQKRSQTQWLPLCRSLHAEALQTTVSEGLAQGPYMVARAGFDLSTLRSIGVVSANAPPCPSMNLSEASQCERSQEKGRFEVSERWGYILPERTGSNGVECLCLKEDLSQWRHCCPDAWNTDQRNEEDGELWQRMKSEISKILRN